MFRSYGHVLDSESGKSQDRRNAVAIGNFDGVHAGHRRLFRRVVAASTENGWRPCVLTFDPHPTKIVAPDRVPKLLSTPEQRLEFMRSEGIEQVFVLPFDHEFAALTPEEFARQILKEGVNAAAIFVGHNFRFGAKQAGNADTLRQLGAELGFAVEIVPDVTVRGRIASSTAVRDLLHSGAVSAACRMLERPYGIEGAIVQGHGIGSKQTVPTLNLETSAEVIPAHGVYITRTTDLEDNRVWRSITNIGLRPTFNGQERTIETFLLTPLEGTSPKRIRLEFLKRVRDERRFENPEELKAQILRDVGRAQTYFRRRAL